MLTGRRRWRAACAATVAVGLAVSCSEPYQPEGQFWPAPAHSGAGVDTNGGGTPASTGGVPAASGGMAVGGGGLVPSLGGGGNGATGGGVFSNGGASAGSAAVGGAGGSAAGPGMASADCKLAVTVTTSDVGGKYKPRNIGAVWVADSSGKFIRSLEVWAARRINHLNAWDDATEAAGADRSRVDIVSQATIANHRTHTSTWGCTDFDNRTVPDGQYRVYFEVTDKDAAGALHFETFEKNGTPATLTPPGSNNFHDIQLVYQP